MLFLLNKGIVVLKGNLNEELYPG